MRVGLVIESIGSSSLSLFFALLCAFAADLFSSSAFKWPAIASSRLSSPRSRVSKSSWPSCATVVRLLLLGIAYSFPPAQRVVRLGLTRDDLDDLLDAVAVRCELVHGVNAQLHPVLEVLDRGDADLLERGDDGALQLPVLLDVGEGLLLGDPWLDRWRLRSRRSLRGSVVRKLLRFGRSRGGGVRPCLGRLGLGRG